MNRDTYLALGDSITAGIGASSQVDSFSFQLGRRLGQKYSIRQRVVMARNGWTTRDIFHAAQMLPHPLWQQIEVMTLITGGNNLRQLLRRQSLPFAKDLTEADITATLSQFDREFHPLCQHIQAQKISHVMIGTMYNPTPYYPLAGIAIQALNQKIRATADNYGFKVVNLDQIFSKRESELIDGYRAGRMEDLAVFFHRPIHPNDNGHRIIADAFYDCYVKKPIKKPTSQKKVGKVVRK